MRKTEFEQAVDIVNSIDIGIDNAYGMILSYGHKLSVEQLMQLQTILNNKLKQVYDSLCNVVSELDQATMHRGEYEIQMRLMQKDIL